MHATSHSDIPDMIHLGDLTEGAICRNILLRYKKDKIYVNFCEKLFFSLKFQSLNFILDIYWINFNCC
jgi:hypothetical protein